MSDIPRKNYRKLSVLLPSLPRIPEYSKSTVAGFMDLHLDYLEKSGGAYTIALSHYYKHPSGDMIPDPDMTMLVDTIRQTVEALTYQDIYRYDQVCIDDVIDQSIRKSLNSFLSQWLQNCIDQGHRFAD
jgi:hypothetical protein